MHHHTTRALRPYAAVLLTTLSLLLPACGGGGGQNLAFAAVISTELPAADAMFRSDADWLGASGTHSVFLGGDRTLWLFGRSWVEPAVPGDRSTATAVRNSIAIQVGLDPTSAAIDFAWGVNAGGDPVEFFPDAPSTWLTPRHGLVLGGELTLFFARERLALPGEPTFTGAVTIGSECLRVENPDADPDAWIVTPVPLPVLGFDAVIGSSVLLQNGFVLAFVIAPGQVGHLARWSETDFVAGQLLAPEWWGPAGWLLHVPGQTAPHPVFEDGASEFSAHFESLRGEFVIAQAHDFFDSRPSFRFADSVTGPWGPCEVVFVPEEIGFSDVAVFGVKAHPHLASSGDVLVTYDSGGLTEQAVNSPDTGFPRFIRLTYE